MAIAIVNGRRMDVPDSGVYGRDIQRAAGETPGRRTVKQGKGLDFEAVDSNQIYREQDLLDRYGQPVKFEVIPDRTKGSFNGCRSPLSKQIITEQVINVAEHLFKDGVDFDEENADWMVVPKFRLPEIWHSIARSTPLLIMFPTEYPELPPIGFYMKAQIPSSPNGHLYNEAFHQASKEPLEHGWQWYCVYIDGGAWQPCSVRKQGDWIYGDNLWQYFTLINEVLASRD